MQPGSANARTNVGAAMDRAIAQARVIKPAPQPDRVGSGVAIAAGGPLIVILEEHERLLHDYGHLFDYLGIRVECARSLRQLAIVTGFEHPMAVLWDLAGSSLDAGRVLRQLAAHDRSLPLLIVADDDVPALGSIDALVLELGLSEVRMLFRRPGVHDIVEFLFQAGHRSGGFRILSA
jgi:hypothetical protein